MSEVIDFDHDVSSQGGSQARPANGGSLLSVTVDEVPFDG